MDMVLNSLYKQTYHALLLQKIIRPLGLTHTFYPVPNYSSQVKASLVRGYSFNIYDNPELLGKDVTENNLSWAGAPGGIVSNSEDVIHWVEQLFIKDKLLDEQQKKEMQQLVSTKTGQPIKKITLKDPQGFGLGLIKSYRRSIGEYWFYQGETLGYRALYMYVPCNKVIISALFNSATNADNDHAGLLLEGLYQATLKQNPSLKCMSKISRR